MRIRPGLTIAAVITVAALVAAPALLRPVLSRWVWNELSTHLQQLFDATLEVDSFEVFLYPTVRVEGKNLRLRMRGQPDGPPLVAVSEFSSTTSLVRLWNGNLRNVTVDGVVITIPPDYRPSMKPADPAEDGGAAAARSKRKNRPLNVDEIVSTHSKLVVTPNNPHGVPLVFDIGLARLRDFSTTEAASFEARLTNPKPRGEISATGKLGPWQSDDPRQTHVEGVYSLKHADMSVFRGIGGSLDSTGRFNGALAAISVEGSTTMDDFSVETGRHPMPLTTQFAARVDGTNGNTYLDRVSAKLGNSPLEATGEIAGAPGSDGKTIKLRVHTDAAQLEDLILLVVSARPTPMRGSLVLNARMELPPGDEPVIDALKLNGQFRIRRGRFASDSVQDKVDELSRRGQGQPKDTTIDNVMSEFGGEFSLKNGLLSLPDFQFAVRGAEVRLAGSYTLRGERLGFLGELRLKARISQTVTGFKSILLKVIDPFFSKHGVGAVLPIRVGGTVTSPEFGLNLFRGRKSDPVSGPAAPPSRGTPSRRPGS